MEMRKMKLLKGTAAIDKGIERVKRDGARYQDFLHVMACSVLAHVGEHRDVRVVGRFVDALPDTVRKQAVRNWFGYFGPIEFNDEDVPCYVKGGKTRLGDGMAKPFWQFNPKQDYKPLDVAEARAAFIKRLKTDEKKTQRSHTALIAALMNVRLETAETANQIAA